MQKPTLAGLFLAGALLAGALGASALVPPALPALPATPRCPRERSRPASRRTCPSPPA